MRKPFRPAVAIACLIAAAVLAKEKPKMSTIVFVCEHGAAKSVVAAAHFNRLAEERHLPYRAVARATEPQEEMAVSAVNGLRAEGLQPQAGHPAKLTQAEVDGAAQIVTFCELPHALAHGAEGKVRQWSAPAVGDGYAAAREVIVEKVKALVGVLESRQ